MKEIHPHIQPLDPYIRARDKIRCLCNKDGHIWSITPNNLLRGHGCPKCSQRKASQAYVKPNELFLSELAEVNENIEVLDDYSRRDVKVKCRCKKDGYIWSARPADLLRGKGCPDCKKRKLKALQTKTHDRYVADIAERNPDIEIIGHYAGSDRKIACKCKIDGHEWTPFAGNIFRGEGCPICARRKTSERFRNTHEHFLNLLSNKAPNITAIGKYVKNDVPITFKCNVCEYVWDATPSTILRHGLCKKCGRSSGEKKVSDYLDSRGIAYETQYSFEDCIDIRCLPFDFYIPEYNLCIEYDGAQHYYPVTFGGNKDTTAEERLAKTQLHVSIKTKYCADNNINLLRIPYWNYNKVDVIVDSKLNTLKAS